MANRIKFTFMNNMKKTEEEVLQLIPSISPELIPIDCHSSRDGINIIFSRDSNLSTIMSEESINRLKNYDLSPKPSKEYNANRTLFITGVTNYITKNDPKEILENFNRSNNNNKANLIFVINNNSNEKARDTLKIIMNTKDDADHLLLNGFWIYNMHIRKERIHKEKQDLVIQCFRCLEYGHNANKCKATKTSCSKCSKEHHYTQCSSTIVKCKNCNGPHVAIANSCPKRKEVIKAMYEAQKQPTSETQAAPETTSNNHFPPLNNRYNTNKASTTSVNNAPQQTQSFHNHQYSQHLISPTNHHQQSSQQTTHINHQQQTQHTNQPNQQQQYVHHQQFTQQIHYPNQQQQTQHNIQANQQQQHEQQAHYSKHQQQQSYNNTQQTNNQMHNTNISSNNEQYIWDTKLDIVKEFARMSANGNPQIFLNIMNKFLVSLGIDPINLEEVQDDNNVTSNVVEQVPDLPPLSPLSYVQLTPPTTMQVPTQTTQSQTSTFSPISQYTVTTTPLNSPTTQSPSIYTNKHITYLYHTPNTTSNQQTAAQRQTHNTNKEQEDCLSCQQILTPQSGENKTTEQTKTNSQNTSYTTDSEQSVNITDTDEDELTDDSNKQTEITQKAKQKQKKKIKTETPQTVRKSGRPRYKKHLL